MAPCCLMGTHGVKMANIQHIVTRFAPSPTGALHLGHAYAAVTAYDAARNSDHGQFRLRMDDIDPGRVRPKYVDGILADLDWLGLRIDGPVVFQSRRMALYAAALEQIRTLGLAYPCFCTRAEIAAEIAASASAPHAGPDGTIYPGTCRGLSVTDRERRIASEPHCWRLDMAGAVKGAMRGHETLHWQDHGAGQRHADPARFGDIVLARKDAGAAYHLSSVADDADMGINLVVRGRDLFDATDVHRLLQALLDLPTPVYAHHPLVLDDTGRRLAKRHDAASLASLRAAGLGGEELAGMLRAGQLPFGFMLESA